MNELFIYTNIIKLNIILFAIKNKNCYQRKNDIYMRLRILPKRESLRAAHNVLHKFILNVKMNEIEQ